MSARQSDRDFCGPIGGGIFCGVSENASKFSTPADSQFSFHILLASLAPTLHTFSTPIPLDSVLRVQQSQKAFWQRFLACSASTTTTRRMSPKRSFAVGRGRLNQKIKPNRE
jgi:hypothetical protein